MWRPLTTPNPQVLVGVVVVQGTEADAVPVDLVVAEIQEVRVAQVVLERRAGESATSAEKGSQGDEVHNSGRTAALHEPNGRRMAVPFDG